MQRVRAAQDRTRIGNDLKQVVTAWFYYPNEHEGQPPRAPQDLIATGRLSPAQQTSLQDGTLVWYYGWRRTIPTDETRAAIQWYARASWFGLHLTGFGLGLVLFGVVTRRRAKRANLANLG